MTCNIREHQSIFNEYKKIGMAGDCNAMDGVRIFFFHTDSNYNNPSSPIYIYIPGTQMLPTKSGKNQFLNVASHTLEYSHKPAVFEIYFTNIWYVTVCKVACSSCNM